TELAGADQSNLERSAFGGAGHEKLVKIHDSILAAFTAAPFAKPTLSQASFECKCQPERHEHDGKHVADQHDRRYLAGLLAELLRHHEVEHRRRQASEQDQKPELRVVEAQ